MHYFIDGLGATHVVGGTRGHDDDPHEQPQGVDHAEQFSARHVLPGIKTSGKGAHGGRSLDAARVDNPCRRLCRATLPLAYQLTQAVSYFLPGTVARPSDVVTMDGVPVREMGG
jgi:hypothetical protein